MTPINRTVRTLWSAMLQTFAYLALSSGAMAQNPLPGAPATNAAQSLMQQMAGTWDVQQRMWPGLGKDAVNLPRAIARRRLVEGSFLEEVMELAQTSGSGQATSFTRTAYFNYNPVAKTYEYFSLDSRAPQMMNERSRDGGEQRKNGGAAIRLYGGRFVAPRWGEATNVAFTYRLTVGAVEGERQVVQLYLTPQSAKPGREFLAFEYVYTRQH